MKIVKKNIYIYIYIYIYVNNLKVRNFKKVKEKWEKQKIISLYLDLWGWILGQNSHCISPNSVTLNSSLDFCYFQIVHD